MVVSDSPEDSTMDLDPRDYDSRDEERFGPDRDRDAHERDVDRTEEASRVADAKAEKTCSARRLRGRTVVQDHRGAERREHEPHE
jgi:hypothetical protein